MSRLEWLLSMGAFAAIIEVLWWVGVGIYMYRIFKEGDAQ
jgi:hypothetical protein